MVVVVVVVVVMVNSYYDDECFPWFSKNLDFGEVLKFLVGPVVLGDLL